MMKPKNTIKEYITWRNLSILRHSASDIEKSLKKALLFKWRAAVALIDRNFGGCSKWLACRVVPQGSEMVIDNQVPRICFW